MKKQTQKTHRKSKSKKRKQFSTVSFFFACLHFVCLFVCFFCFRLLFVIFDFFSVCSIFACSLHCGCFFPLFAFCLFMCIVFAFLFAFFWCFFIAMFFQVFVFIRDSLSGFLDFTRTFQKHPYCLAASLKPKEQHNRSETNENNKLPNILPRCFWIEAELNA